VAWPGVTGRQERTWKHILGVEGRDDDEFGMRWAEKVRYEG
jgi:hypothetical protein